MEDDLVAGLYGDLSQDQCRSVVSCNEDSVDIYSGLDTSPGSNEETTCKLFSPRRIKSMDLYEEILAEEQHSKESAQNELKERFIAAQSQVEELRKRLELLETKNTALNTENGHLKKNICALMKTARLEIVRKDEEIMRLSQRSGRANVHHPPRINGVRDPVSARLNSLGHCRSTGPSRPTPPTQPPVPRVDHASKDPPPPPPPLCPPPPPPPPPSLPPPPPPSLPPLPKSPCNKKDVIRHSAASNSRPLHVNSKNRNRRENEAPIKPTDSAVIKASSESVRGVLDKHKQTKHREEKCVNPRPSGSTERRHEKILETYEKGQGEERSKSLRAHRMSGRHDSKSSKSKNYSPNIEVHKRLERSKSAVTEIVDSTVLFAHESKSSSKTSSETRSKRDGREWHDKDEHGPSRSSKDLSSSRRHKGGNSSHHSLTERSSEPLNHKRGISPPRDHRRKEERKRADDRKFREKRSGSFKETSKERKHIKDSESRKMEPSSKDEEKTTRVGSDIPPSEPNGVEKSIVEENSPNRKLSFMETLNLTLSPVKTTRRLSGSEEHGDSHPEGNAEDPSMETSGQLDMEDFCVIDEVDSSESVEINTSHVVETKESLRDSAVQPSSDGPVPHDSASINGTFLVEEPHQKNDKSVAIKEPIESNDPVTDSLKCSVKESKATENPHTPELLKESCVAAPDTKLVMGISIDSTSVHHAVESEDQATATCLTVSQEDNMKCHPSETKISDNETRQSVGLTDGWNRNLNPETSSVLLCKSQATESITREAVDPSAEDEKGKAKPESQPSPLRIQFEGYPQQLSTSFPVHHSPEKCSPHKKDVSIEADRVSSTISMDVLPQYELAYEGHTNVNLMDNAIDETSVVHSSPLGIIAVSKVSSTTEEVPPSENLSTVMVKSPKVSCNTDSSCKKNEEETVEPTSSMPLVHDEESMMKTLNSLKEIPDPISPLTSPIRLTRRNQPHCQANKPAHVKSLGKEFSSAVIDVPSIKVDVNKENKNPGGPTKGLPKVQTEDELEEGEIVSESDEDESPVSSPTIKPTKADHPSPQTLSRLCKRAPEKTLAVSQESPITKSKAKSPSSGSPSSNRSRHKTICLPATTNSISTTEDVIDMIGKIRHQVRKKYMKLHKSFPIGSFYGIIDNAHVSFSDFVDRVSFSKLCDHGDDLKSRLKNIIANVLSKISKNGIVNRIFEQQSEFLKKKLWNFVDVQLDFMFNEIRAELNSVCKASKENRPSSSVKGEDLHRIKKTTKLLKSPETRTTRLNTKLSKSPVATKPRPKLQLPKSTVTTTSRSKMRLSKSPVTIPSRPRVTQKMEESVETNTQRTMSVGLGSRGKNIKMTLDEEEQETSPNAQTSDRPTKQSVVKMLPPKNTPSTSAQETTMARRLSQNSSVHDKSDFQILTEQQASSLTFNLVTDSQMGDIFKCLLDGSDLLDSSISAVDCNGWPIGTPRKEATPGEHLLSITPSKMCSPSKLIATWSAISPRKISTSPNGKVHIPVIPAVFDESCMLEVPGDLSQGKMVPRSNVFSQRSYSILAEDLAVSLTIPSPLKSDSHLSFLHPVNGEPVSAPDSVISAHFSEDALLEGEDATEQDIHLALDTDNSSCGSSGGRSRESAAPLLFHFKPHLPMQAVVMEKSNDHFILKIRQAATSTGVPSEGEDTLTKPPREEHYKKDHNSATQASAEQALSSEDRTLSLPPSIEIVNGKARPEVQSESGSEGTEDSTSSGKTLSIEKTCKIPDKNHKDHERGLKRKKELVKPKAKRVKEEVTWEKSKQKASKSSKKNSNRTPRKERSKVTAPTVQLSPNSLSAKNVIKKKGEVVVMWNKDEDRAILLELKMKGASSNTFNALSDKLNKSPAQIAERFGQLMKLFKKKEKMES